VFSKYDLATLAFCSGAHVIIMYGTQCFPLLCPALTSLFPSVIEVAGTFLLTGPEGSVKPLLHATRQMLEHHGVSLL